MRIIIIIFIIIITFGAPAMAGARLPLKTTKTSVFTQKINRLLPEPHAGLLNGILFGEKAKMDGRFFDQLRRTGTLHVIALSGMNITILVNFLGQVTLFLGRRKSTVLSIIMIIIFINLVGASASVVRAGIMGAITLIGLYFGRQSWGALSLLFAGGIMLLIKPVWLYDLGFQLSFLATAGIIVVGGVGEVRGLRGNLMADLRTTLAAQVFTLPVLLYNFGQISLIAPLANVLVLWVVQPIMILGLGLCVVGYVIWPLAVLLAWVVWVPLTYFIKVIELTAQIPFASVSF